MKRGVPVAFLNIIINWYSKLSIMVRWNTTFSDTLRIRSGVRQGGVLSPHLFNVYADVFINSVVSKNTGCYLNRCCMACIMYADELMLLGRQPRDVWLDELGTNIRPWYCIGVT